LYEQDFVPGFISKQRQNTSILSQKAISMWSILGDNFSFYTQTIFINSKETGGRAQYCRSVALAERLELTGLILMPLIPGPTLLAIQV